MERFENPDVLNLVISVVAGLWTLFKASEWYREHTAAKKRIAVDAIEAGVAHTYEAYVRALKAASADGQLTDEERRKARALAKSAAYEYGREHGVNILKVVGEGFLDLYIEQAVAKLKRMVL